MAKSSQDVLTWPAWGPRVSISHMFAKVAAPPLIAGADPTTIPYTRRYVGHRVDQTGEGSVAQPTLTPRAFAQKWRDNETKEKAASQEHFIDLCRMLGEPTPNEADPTGSTYGFEKAITKAAGGDGFADVWKKDFFGWDGSGPNRPRAMISVLRTHVVRASWRAVRR